MPTTKYRSNADGTAVCPHRDLSVCASCATDPTLVESMGAHYHVPDPADRAEFVATMAAIDAEYADA